MNSPGSVLMMPFSTLFRAITSARSAAYRSGIFKTNRLAAPVISVGNLTTGGTGKTPLVEWVCRTIASTQIPKQICVLTRGYGKANPRQQVVVSNGADVLADERDAGDEPFLLANNLRGLAAVVSNPDRIAAGNWASENLQADAFVLDDGFQHLRLARDLDIVVIDATNPFGGGELLPQGRLRETPHALIRADCIVVTRCDQTNNLDALLTELRNFVGDRPILTSRMEVYRYRTLGGEEVQNVTDLAHPLAAFCGIGNPSSFFDLLREAGLQINTKHSFPDHHRYSSAETDRLVGDCVAAGARALITTGKDAVKLQSIHFTVPCYVLEIRIAIDDDQRLIQMLTEAISLTPKKS